MEPSHTTTTKYNSFGLSYSSSLLFFFSYFLLFSVLPNTIDFWTWDTRFTIIFFVSLLSLLLICDKGFTLWLGMFSNEPFKIPISNFLFQFLKSISMCVISIISSLIRVSTFFLNSLWKYWIRGGILSCFGRFLRESSFRLRKNLSAS